MFRVWRRLLGLCGKTVLEEVELDEDEQVVVAHVRDPGSGENAGVDGVGAARLGSIMGKGDIAVDLRPRGPHLTWHLTGVPRGGCPTGVLCGPWGHGRGGAVGAAGRAAHVRVRGHRRVVGGPVSFSPSRVREQACSGDRGR